jgi:hypothetical protein
VADFFQLSGPRRYLCLAGLALAALLAAACGGGGGSGGGGSSTTIFVSVSPAAASVAVNASQQFTATVTGTTNSQVTWSVAGSGCSGTACGTITAAGLYTAPGAVPNPATVTVTATSVANPARSGSATVTIVLAGAPVIGTLRPSSLRAGQASGAILRVVGQNFVTGTSVIFDGSARAATCPTLAECTIDLTAADLALARNVAVQVRQPDGTLSNAVSFVIVAADLTEGIIELTPAAREADAGTLAVLDPSNQGEQSTPPAQMNITHIGIAPTGGSCGGVAGRSIKFQRPGAGAMDVFVCLSGERLSAGDTFRISGPTPNDILLTNPTQSGSAVVVTLTISSATQPGARTIFVTNARGDVTATAGGIDIQ